MTKTTKKLIIIDSNALIHRAFHALPPTMSALDGTPTNAVYGYTSILLKAIKDLKPDYIAATYDLRGPTFRHKKYSEYKAGRTKPPQELYDQIPLTKEVLNAFGISIFEKQGFEADDLIGTIAHLKSVDNSHIESIILTGDQDILQLVDDNTKVLSPVKGMGETMLYDEEAVKEKFDGLTPAQLIDYKGIRGDPSDNLPGVRGIGHKGAVELLLNFKTLEGIYENINSDKIRDRTRQLLIDNEKEARLSKELATIIKQVDIDFDLEKCVMHQIDYQKTTDLFQRLNFKRLLAQLSTLNKSGILTESGQQGGLFDNPQKPEDKFKSKKYQLVNNDKEYKRFKKLLDNQKEFCFDTETTSIKPFQAELLGISFSWQKDVAYYLTKDIVSKNKKELNQIFKDEKIKKIAQNIKYDIEVLENHGLEVNGIYFDTMIASYLLSPGSRQHNLDTMAFVELGYQMQPIEELIGRGKDQICLSDVGIEKVCNYSCEDADLTWQLYKKLKPQLKKQNFWGLFEKIDMPLVRALANTEKNGVKINSRKLKRLSQEAEIEIKKITKKVHKLTGEDFNLASPKQLKDVLFNKLKISSQGLKKTKTGISTAAGELDKLAGSHKAIDLILKFRELSKLKNTYFDALPKLVNLKDKRIHTSFNATVTATGRLSSSDPNLQNIPTRTAAGRKIRTAFTANPGFKIVKADYSQIELRIAASLANDKKMLEAFEKKEDIHTQTAAAINDVKIEDVTKSMRRQAKEVNFGVLYGMGAWGLAQRTGISNGEAQTFIDKYFSTYKRVKKYTEETINIVKEKGYIETLYGRRRYLPEINSGVSQIQKAAERMAINTPIQGTGADLIKLAMIEIDKELKNISKEGKMILQVHDELVFEVPNDDVEKVAKFVEEKMNGVCKLRAPIETEVSVGNNWGETKVI
jgi:DNA polymerase I